MLALIVTAVSTCHLAYLPSAHFHGSLGCGTCMLSTATLLDIAFGYALPAILYGVGRRVTPDALRERKPVYYHKLMHDLLQVATGAQPVATHGLSNAQIIAATQWDAIADEMTKTLNQFMYYSSKYVAFASVSSQSHALASLFVVRS
ncbi:hypothetical protein BDZ89DRAFT_1159931 [Hymenopellis radicata]|nr:hypothetical protein BDZ89DRAFT_1159931 [Hymenopellis radicata]